MPWRKYKVCLKEDQVYAMSADDLEKLNKDKKKVERLAAAFHDDYDAVIAATMIKQIPRLHGPGPRPRPRLNKVRI